MRGTISAGAATDVGKVRKHNEDSHRADVENGAFMVADGMGGHASGEVASAMAVEIAGDAWTSPSMRTLVLDYAARADAETRRKLLAAVQQGVMNAHLAILDATAADQRRGMGTTFTGFLVAGGDAVFAHAGDSRAYLVRDQIAIQLSEDHTLLARLRAAGVEPTNESGDPNRFKGVLTNGLGIGGATHIGTFVVPMCSGDRFVLCSDGVHDYLSEAEIGEIIVEAPGPARAAQRLIEIALDRGGEDNATAVVVEVMEAGTTRIPAKRREADERAVERCSLFAELTLPERLRALRITIERQHEAGEQLRPVALGERVAYVVLEGRLALAGVTLGPGALVYPEALVDGTEPPERSMLATAETDVRLLTIRRDDFFEITEEDSDLGVKMYAVLAKLMAR